MSNNRLIDLPPVLSCRPCKPRAVPQGAEPLAKPPRGTPARHGTAAEPGSAPGVCPRPSAQLPVMEEFPVGSLLNWEAVPKGGWLGTSAPGAVMGAMREGGKRSVGLGFSSPCKQSE